jgi:hypothetical protein
MSRQAALLVLSLVVATMFVTAGCIDVKEKPPQGSFTIEVAAEEMFFIDDSGGPLVGPHGHLETEIAHEHEEYAWDIEGLGEFEGAEVDLPAHATGVRQASYNVHFIEEANHTDLTVATVPDLSNNYFVIGDGTGLGEGDDSTHTPVFDTVWGPNLTQVQSDAHGTIMEYGGLLTEPMAVELELNETTTESSVYLVGTHLMMEDVLEEDIASIVINPSEVHFLSYLNGHLSIMIFSVVLSDIVQPPIFNGSYNDLPKEYRTHIGQLEWEGHVGEPEETPGFGPLMSVLAMATIAVLVVRGRRR